MKRARVLGLYAVLLFLFMLILCRAFLLAQNTDYAGRAERQSETTLTVSTQRGNFYDCNGERLTGLETGWRVLCLPRGENYSRLFECVSYSQQKLLYQKRNTATPFLLEVERDLTEEGIFSVPFSRRYARVPLCTHLIGYLDGEGRGTDGLEAAFEEILAGSGQKDTVECTTNAQGSLLEGTQPVYYAAEGETIGVQLTIDRRIQRAAEAVAAQYMTTGCIVILECPTAKVRACVSVPSYDPNQLEKSLSDEEGAWTNRAFHSYAAGSVFKPVVAAAALRQGVTELHYECGGGLQLGEHLYRCAGGIAHGETDLSLALQKSCNGYFVALGREVGVSAVYEMAQRCGFGRAVYLAGGLKTSEGNLPEESELEESRGEFANFCFGQGKLLVSPVQIAGFFHAIASGGVYRTPSFLERSLKEQTGETVETLYHPAQREILSPEQSARLCELLRGVVEEGTGKEAKPSHGTAGGKTGTAQTGQHSTEGEEYKNLWFAGFYPAEHPRYVAVVMQDKQLHAEYSSAFLFSQLCERLYWLDEALQEQIEGETETEEEGSGSDGGNR